MVENDITEPHILLLFSLLTAQLITFRSLPSPIYLVRCLSSYYKEQIRQGKKHFLQDLIGKALDFKKEKSISLFS
jgi:hypothetical protein